MSSFKYADLDQTLPEFEGGAADADTMWERIDYFLARVVPVAERVQGAVGLPSRRTRASRTTSTGAWRVSWARLAG